MRYDRRVAFLILIVALDVPLARAQNDRDAAARLDVSEAAVRWSLTSREVAAAETVYLEVDQGPPSEALLTRLGDIRKLLSVAECPQVESHGRLGCRPPKGTLVVEVWDVTILGRASARAHVGHYEGATSQLACEEFFTRLESGWRRRPARADESYECGVS